MLVRDKVGQIGTEVAVNTCQSRSPNTHQTKCIYKTTGTFYIGIKKSHKERSEMIIWKKTGFGCHYSHAPTKCWIFLVEATGSFRVTQVKNREYLQPNSTVGTTEYKEQTTYFKYLRVPIMEITSCHPSGECLVLWGVTKFFYLWAPWFTVMLGDKMVTFHAIMYFNSSRDEAHENSRIHLDRSQNKYTNCKGIKNNTNFG